MGKWFKSGTPWIWMTGGAVSLSLIAVVGLILLIGWRGLSFFWPSEIYEFDIVNEQGQHANLIGEIYDSETVLKQQLVEAGVKGLENEADELDRYLIKVGNREFVDLDFMWVLGTTIKDERLADGIVVFERTKNGNFYGYLTEIKENGVVVSDDSMSLIQQLQQRLERTIELNDKEEDLLTGDIGAINYALDRIRLNKRKAELDDELTTEKIAEFDKESADLHQQYLVLEKQLFDYREEADRDSVTVKDMRGQDVTLSMADI